MKRTINEIKAYRKIFLGSIFLVMQLIFIGFGIKSGSIFLSLSGYCMFWIGVILLFYGAYSLGWEYKRISSH